MSNRDDEVMRILGKLEARADSTHEYVVAVSEKLARHVEDKDLHAPATGINLKLLHAVSLSTLLPIAGAAIAKGWDKLVSLIHSVPVPPVPPHHGG